MFWIALGLIVAAFVLGYLSGWVRGKKGLAKIPFTVGAGGIHTRPLILFALLAARAPLGCTNKYAPHAPADTTAVADSDRDDGDHDRDHDQGKKHKDYDHDGDHEHR